MLADNLDHIPRRTEAKGLDGVRHPRSGLGLEVNPYDFSSGSLDLLLMVKHEAGFRRPWVISVWLLI